MKTTLTVDDRVMTRLKEEAARRRVTMSALVESALRRLLDEHPRPCKLAALPSFDGGGARVDIADRQALYDAMEPR